MTAAQLEIQLVAVTVAIACALPGVFLVLRRMALLSDAISHAILLGIVMAFFATHDLASPLLVLGAAMTGVATVALVELLNRTRLVKEDAAIGLVFPLLFSTAVILISKYAGRVHLDTDAVLLGELAFAPFNRLVAFGADLGPKSFYVMAVILFANLVFFALFYKELKLATFDAGLAATLGFSPVLIHYALTTLVSVTAVGAFDAVGSILVVALMIAPPATAYLLTDRLSKMLALAALFGMASAISGYWVAHVLDVSIAGSMAVMSGVFFGVALFASPQQGLVAAALRRRRQRWDFAQIMLVIHLLHHEHTPEADVENSVEHLRDYLRWSGDFAEAVVHRAEKRGWIGSARGMLSLTEAGRTTARQAMAA
jgi:manganese/zinc/iron transport system permease protein